MSLSIALYSLVQCYTLDSEYNNLSFYSVALNNPLLKYMLKKIYYVLFIVVTLAIIFLIKYFIYTVPIKSALSVYTDTAQKFTLKYSVGYGVDTSYTYTNLGPSISIPGVKFTIPSIVATGTNLSSDTYLSVEHRNNVTRCTPDNFLLISSSSSYSSIVDGSITYNVASSTGAGAGNRYEEYVYAIDGSNPCIAIRYFIHSTAIENYTPGTKTEFNKNALLSQLDTIRKSLILKQ